MINNNQKRTKIQQNKIQHQVSKTDSYSFFNLLTSPELLSTVEDQLPEHRERLYSPTTTLSLFLAQAMNADSSCQNTVDRHAVERIFNGLPTCSVLTGGIVKPGNAYPLKWSQNWLGKQVKWSLKKYRLTGAGMGVA